MYLINTSFIVSPAAHKRWLPFFSEKVLPHLRDRGYSLVAFSRVLHDTAEDHYTYSLLLDVAELPDFLRFRSEILEEYTTMAQPLFGDGALYFVTLMKKLDI